MKKILFAFILSSLISVPAFAKCEGGDEYTVNGHTYCVGPEMAWWAAFAWCEAQGRHLVSMAEACPGWGGGECISCCPTSALGYVWTANPVSNDATKAYGLGESNVYRKTRSATSLYRAACY